MASEYTEGLGVELIGAGDKAGSWGDVTNNNLRALEEGLSRYAEIILTPGTTASDLDIPDGTAAYSVDSKGRSSVINWSGIVPPVHTVTLKVGGNPRAHARFTAVNSLSGVSDLVISCGAGTNVTIPNGYSAVIHIDGTNVVNSLANLSVDTLISSGTITGNVDGNVTGQAGTVVTVPTLSGDVTNSGNIITIPPGSITEAQLAITGSPTTNYVLTATNGSGGMGWTAPSGGVTSISGGSGISITGTASAPTVIADSTIARTSDPVKQLSGAVTTNGITSLTTLTTDAVTTAKIATSAVTAPKLSTTGSTTNGNILSVTGSGAGLEWIPPGTAGNVTSVTGGAGITVTNGTSASPTVAVDSTVVRTPGTVVRTAGIQTLSQKTLSSPTITGTGNIEGSNLVGSSSVATPSLTSTGALSISPTGALSISPGFLQRIDLSSSFIDTGSGSAISLTTSSGPLLLETTNSSASSGTIKFQTKDSSNSSVVQANVNQEGIALLSSGGQYLNMNTAYGVNGFGLRGNDSSSDVLGIKNSVGDAWGQPYHTNMVSGQGAYVEVATVYTRITNGTFTFDVSSLGIASGDMPSLVELWMKRTGLAPEVGYVTNDWVRPIIGADAGNNSVGSTISSTHNTVTLSIMGGAGANGSFYAIGKDTPGGAAKNYFVFGNTGWTLVCKAWK